MKQMLILLIFLILSVNVQIIYIIYNTSRHTIVCRAAQEAGAPHREYIDRKKERKRHFHTFVFR